MCGVMCSSFHVTYGVMLLLCCVFSTVARDSSNPECMKYVLQGLCCHWMPDIDVLFLANTLNVATESAANHRPSINDVNNGERLRLFIEITYWLNLTVNSVFKPNSSTCTFGCCV